MIVGIIKERNQALEEEEEKKLFIAHRLSVTMSIELLLFYYCCFFYKYKSKFECMNTFLQHFSNFNLTNQLIDIHRFYILHQKIYGTNINKTNVKNINSKNIKRLIKAIEIIPKIIIVLTKRD